MDVADEPDADDEEAVLVLRVELWELEANEAAFESSLAPHTPLLTAAPTDDLR